MNRLTLKDRSSKQVTEIITLTLQLGGFSESTLYTRGAHDLPNGEYNIEEFNLRIKITRGDDNRYQFVILGQD